MPVDSTEMSILCKKKQHLFRHGTYRRATTFTYALTECLNKRENAVSLNISPERHSRRVIPGFQPVRTLSDAVGPSLLINTDLLLGTAMRERNVN